jgi:hypothetical protein
MSLYKNYIHKSWKVPNDRVGIRQKKILSPTFLCMMHCVYSIELQGAQKHIRYTKILMQFVKFPVYHFKRNEYLENHVSVVV